MNEKENIDENPVDPEYVSIHQDVELLSNHLATVSAEIRRLEISNYPVFLAHFQPVEFAKPLFNRDEHSTNWDVSMSTLEVLVKNDIIDQSRVDDFIKIYKDPDQQFCFLVMKEVPQFIFIKKPRS